MLHSVTTKGLKASTLYKLLFIGYLFFWGPIIIILGMLSIFDITSVTIMDKNYTGLAGFIGSLLLTLFVPLIIATFNWLILSAGLWIYAKFKNIKIIYKSTFDEDDKIIGNNQPEL